MGAELTETFQLKWGWN